MSARAERAATATAERDLDLLLVTSLPNLRWLTGFTGTNGACVIGPERRVFFTDSRYVEQAKQQVGDFEITHSGPDLLGAVARELQGRTGFEDVHMSVRAHQRLEKLAEGAELVGASGIVEELRETKDESELEAMRDAARIADLAYERLADSTLGERTELELAADLEAFMRSAGAEGRAFATIVASGAHGALPHAQPRAVPVERDTLLVVDMGCVVDGYCSDCTRTFATGAIDDEALAVYELVAEAQLAGLAAATAGAAGRAVDKVARDVIAAAGRAEQFGHGLGHGVGLEIHEEPRLGQTSESVLKASTTVTVEPGVYVPGRFGVRIEDLVVVNESGPPTILTGFTKELITLR